MKISASLTTPTNWLVSGFITGMASPKKVDATSLAFSIELPRAIEMGFLSTTFNSVFFSGELTKSCNFTLPIRLPATVRQ